MRKTTVYLPDDLKSQLALAAAETGRSEADLIREGVRLVVSRRHPPPPTIPLFVSGDATFAMRADEHLTGFGEQ